MLDKTKYLSIDYGLRRVGIAVSDEDKKYSFSRDFLYNDNSLYINLLLLIKQEKISRIILGYPLNFKSEKTSQTIEVEKFKQKLESVLQDNSPTISVVLFDERLTSNLAKQNIISSGLKKKKRQNKGLIDSTAAQIILQDYMDSLAHKN
ncbi:MAG: Holliday junction resolvase RuvX [Ignavibacteria bacterium]|nr:Holliday junction resolvase RuvX [Ignavibacteria bacterium]